MAHFNQQGLILQNRISVSFVQSATAKPVIIVGDAVATCVLSRYTMVKSCLAENSPKTLVSEIARATSSFRQSVDFCRVVTLTTYHHHEYWKHNYENNPVLSAVSEDTNESSTESYTQETDSSGHGTFIYYINSTLHSSSISIMYR